MDSDPLGIFSSLVIQRKEVQVSPGDRFYLYTDGLIESSPGGGRGEGLDRLVASCVLHRGGSAPASSRRDCRAAFSLARPRYDDYCFWRWNCRMKSRAANCEWILRPRWRRWKIFALEFQRWRAAACAELDAFSSELLLREALTNAVVHGGTESPRERISCVLRVKRGRLIIAIRDGGQGFDWRAAWDRQAAASRHARPGHGDLTALRERGPLQSSRKFSDVDSSDFER